MPTRTTSLSSLPSELQTRIASLVRGNSPNDRSTYSRTDLLNLGRVNKHWTELIKPLISEFMLETLWSPPKEVPVSAFVHVRTAVVGLSSYRGLYIQILMKDPAMEAEQIEAAIFQVDVNSAHRIRQCTGLREIRMYTEREKKLDILHSMPYTLHAVLSCQTITRLSAPTLQDHLEIEIVAQLVSGLLQLEELAVNVLGDKAHMQAAATGDVVLYSEAHLARFQFTQNLFRARNLLCLDIRGDCLTSEPPNPQFQSKLKLLSIAGQYAVDMVGDMLENSASTLEEASVSSLNLGLPETASTQPLHLPKLRSLFVTSSGRGALEAIAVDVLPRADNLQNLHMVAKEDGIDFAIRVLEAGVYPSLQTVSVAQEENRGASQGLEEICKQEGIRIQIKSFDDVVSAYEEMQDSGGSENDEEEQEGWETTSEQE